MGSRIRRWVETDTGHRVPNHKSKCRNMHGHRYRWEAELEGDVITERGASDEGMVMDFSDVSEILTTYIHDIVDHAFIVYEKDDVAISALSHMPDGHRTLVVPFIPTDSNCFSTCNRLSGLLSKLIYKMFFISMDKIIY